MQQGSQHAHLIMHQLLVSHQRLRGSNFPLSVRFLDLPPQLPHSLLILRKRRKSIYLLSARSVLVSASNKKS